MIDLTVSEDSGGTWRGEEDRDGDGVRRSAERGGAPRAALRTSTLEKKPVTSAAGFVALDFRDEIKGTSSSALDSAVKPTPRNNSASLDDSVKPSVYRPETSAPAEAFFFSGDCPTFLGESSRCSPPPV